MVDKQSLKRIEEEVKAVAELSGWFFNHRSNEVTTLVDGGKKVRRYITFVAENKRNPLYALTPLEVESELKAYVYNRHKLIAVEKETELGVKKLKFVFEKEIEDLGSYW